MGPEALIEEVARQHRGFRVLAPSEMEVSELRLGRVLAVGACLIQALFEDGKMDSAVFVKARGAFAAACAPR